MEMTLITATHFLFIFFCLATIIDQTIIIRNASKKITELEALERIGFPKEHEISTEREKMGQATMCIVTAILAGYFLTKQLF